MKGEVEPDTGEFQIYLSSTLDDLRDERAAAIEILRRHGRVIDSYRAGPEPTVANCLSDVRGSQLYVLIMGRRYGWVPAGEADPEATSITEQEYSLRRPLVSAHPAPRVRTHDEPRSFQRRQHASADRRADAALPHPRASRAAGLHVRYAAAVHPCAHRGGHACACGLAGRTPRGASAPSRRASRGAVGIRTDASTTARIPRARRDGGAGVDGGCAGEPRVRARPRQQPGIVVTSVVPGWTFEPLDATAPVHYEIDGAALTPQGFFTPERFTLVLAGQALRGASWTNGVGTGMVKTIDADLLNTDPPRQI